MSLVSSAFSLHNSLHKFEFSKKITNFVFKV
jgi:hypothetical protein